MSNLGGFSMISQGRSENGRGVRRGGGNQRYNLHPRSLFSPDPNRPIGRDPNDETKLIYGNTSDYSQPNQQSQQGGVTGLTPVPKIQRYQAPNVLAIQPGVKTSTYAPQPIPNPVVHQNVKLNLDQPSPTATTSKSPQTESSNPLTGDTNAQPTGKTTGLTPVPPSPSLDYQSTPDVDHARALGLSTKGNSTPTGDDIPISASTTDQHVKTDLFTGGTGQYQKPFTNSTSASIYSDYVKKLFGRNTQDTDESTGYDDN